MSEFNRPCPNCGTTIAYQNKHSLSTGTRRKSLCKRCTSIKTGFTARFATPGRNTGTANGFFGKTHTADARRRMGQQDRSHSKTDEFRQKMSEVTKGENNPMFGRRIMDVWVEKYGADAAQVRNGEWRRRLSVATSGSNNPMFGKPSPQGAGNGWSGWYKGWYFRSIRELSYVVMYLEPSGVMWRTAEALGIRIPYVDPTGHERTYTPDFLVNERQLVEIKPLRLHGSPLVVAKKAAAEKFCGLHGFEYLLLSPEVLSDDAIRQLVDAGEVKWTERYSRLYAERIATGDSDKGLSRKR